jgi:hypothetical protein
MKAIPLLAFVFGYLVGFGPEISLDMAPLLAIIVGCFAFIAVDETTRPLSPRRHRSTGQAPSPRSSLVSRGQISPVRRERGTQGFGVQPQN